MRVIWCFILSLGVGACQQTWQRFDGQSVAASAALERQYAVDLETCRAFAMNAGNQVQTSPAIPVAGNVNITNNVMIDTAPRPAWANAQLAPPPNIATAGAMDPAVFANAGASIGAAGRRWRTEDANMRACMAQRGYH
jgi:hypothetical protein